MWRTGLSGKSYSLQAYENTTDIAALYLLTVAFDNWLDKKDRVVLISKLRA